MAAAKRYTVCLYGLFACDVHFKQTVELFCCCFMRKYILVSQLAILV